MKILIADDDSSTQILLKEILFRFGECNLCEDGEEAVNAFRTAYENHDPYDLITMDIMMPKLDGHKALKQIRIIEKELDVKETDKAKVIMVTALGDTMNIEEAMHYGDATSYIIKPIAKNTLLLKLKEMFPDQEIY